MNWCKMETPMALLTQCKPPRSLAIALAHCFASCKPTDQRRLELLNRIHSRLSFAESFQCRKELLECRHAKQRGILAAVGG
jgi:hypothetical protein